MASIDKAAIVFSIAIALVGVAVAAVGSSVDNSPAAPSQQMSSAMNTDAAEKAAAEKAVLTFAEKVAKAIEAEDKTEYTVHKWTPERNSDAYQTGVKKVSPEEAKQRMEEMFGGTGLPMPGSSEGLKHVIPTEKEMFDSRMLAEANSPKSSPAYEPPKAKQWWCFWC